MISAFGVEHGETFAKAGSEYRDSYLSGLNPRSKVKVKRGSAPRRYVKAVGGEAGGAIGGYALGRALKSGPGMTNLLATGGALAGGSAARTSNIKRGDVVARHKKSGKKATGFIGFGPNNLGIGGLTYN